MTPAQVLASLRQDRPTQPRLTWYGPGLAERVELSGRVLDNWVSKAANLLQEELDAGAGSRVRLDLPVGHWRACYWALAAWAVGATVAWPAPAHPAPANVVVTDAPLGPQPHGAAVVVITLPALARAYPGTLPAGAIDEARVLGAYPDAVTPWTPPGLEDAALEAEPGWLSFGELGPGGASRVGRALLTAGAGLAPRLMVQAFRVWAAGGSVVVAPGSGSEREAAALRSEGIEAGPLVGAGLDELLGPIRWRPWR